MICTNPDHFFCNSHAPFPLTPFPEHLHPLPHRNCVHTRGSQIRRSPPFNQRSHAVHGLPSEQDVFDLDELVVSLTRCGKASALDHGRYLHCLICKCGYDCSTFLGNCLIQMYGECGSAREAQSAFFRIPSPNLFSWNLLMKAYLLCGDFHSVEFIFYAMPQQDVISWTCMIKALTVKGDDMEALRLFYEMQQSEIQPNRVTYVCVLDACNSPHALTDGYEIHASIIYSGCKLDAMIGTALISMYGKCQSLCSARVVFCMIDTKDVITWNSMISASVENGQCEAASDIYSHMCSAGIEPDSFTYVSILDACTVLRDLQQGENIHSRISRTAYKNDIAVNNALITFYGKCASLEVAIQLFDDMKERDVITWGALIAACTLNGCEGKALHFFHQMQQCGFIPTTITFIFMLDGCSIFSDGSMVHAFLVKLGYDHDVSVGNALVNFYSRLHNMTEVEAVFEKMLHRDATSWNNYICHKGHVKESVELFFRMQLEGVLPDPTTFILVLETCAILNDVDTGRRCHVVFGSSCHLHDVAVENALITMYGKCRRLDEAKGTFEGMSHPNIVSWNAVITAYVQNGENMKALDHFYQLQKIGMLPDRVTFICVLNACDTPEHLDEGRNIHATSIDMGYESYQEVQHALISMYGKCCIVEASMIVFNKMHYKTVVSWNAALTACKQNGEDVMALALFREMKHEQVEPDKITCICALDACASVVALSEGEDIYRTIILGKKWEIDNVLGNALINMYGKCGNISKARSILRNMTDRDIVSWSSLIAACAQNGQGDEALLLFHQMQQEGITPNDVSFTCALTACSQVGHVHHGRQIFASISEDYGMSPTPEHYTCMIDLLSRAGHLDEAEDLIERMPYKKSPMVWLSLLGACKKYGDVERAARVSKNCADLEPENAASYVLLANIYSHSDDEHGK